MPILRFDLGRPRRMGALAARLLHGFGSIAWQTCQHVTKGLPFQHSPYSRQRPALMLMELGLGRRLSLMPIRMAMSLSCSAALGRCLES